MDKQRYNLPHKYELGNSNSDEDCWAWWWDLWIISPWFYRVGILNRSLSLNLFVFHYSVTPPAIACCIWYKWIKNADRHCKLLINILRTFLLFSCWTSNSAPAPSFIRSKKCKSLLYICRQIDIVKLYTIWLYETLYYT